MKAKNCIIGTRVQIKESADVSEGFKGAFGTIASQVGDSMFSVRIDGIGTRTGFLPEFFPEEMRLANKIGEIK